MLTWGSRGAHLVGLVVELELVDRGLARRVDHHLELDLQDESTSTLAKKKNTHSVRFVSIRAADFSVKSAQAPRPYWQALIKTIWRGSDRVDCITWRMPLSGIPAAFFFRSNGRPPLPLKGDREP